MTGAAEMYCAVSDVSLARGAGHTWVGVFEVRSNGGTASAIACGTRLACVFQARSEFGQQSRNIRHRRGSWRASMDALKGVEVAKAIMF